MCIEYNNKVYSDNEFKVALLKGEFDALVKRGVLQNPSVEVIKQKGEGNKSTAQEITNEHPEIKSLETERDAKIKEASKPDLKLELISSKDLVKAKDAIEAKEQHDIIKEKYKALRKLADCI